MDNAKIVEYSKQTTDPKNPFQRKLVQAFIESMLNSNDIVELRNEGKPLSNFTYESANRFLYLSSIHSDVALVQDDVMLSIIAYSKKRKDTKLFSMISDRFFTGFIANYASLNLDLDTFSTTDYGHQSLQYENIVELGYKNGEWFTKTEDMGYANTVTTDIGGHTDTDVGQSIIAYYNFYTNDVVIRNKLIVDEVFKCQLFDDMTRNVTYAKNVLHIVKPARVNVCFLYVPTVYIGAESYDDDTGFAYGIELTSSNPFDDVSQLELMQNPNEQTFGEMVSTTGIPCYLRDYDDFTRVDETEDYYFVKRLFHITHLETETDLTSDNIWKEVTIRYNNIGGIVEVKGKINCAELQDSSDVYFVWVVFKIPKENE